MEYRQPHDADAPDMSITVNGFGLNHQQYRLRGADIIHRIGSAGIRVDHLWGDHVCRGVAIGYALYFPAVSMGDWVTTCFLDGDHGRFNDL